MHIMIDLETLGVRPTSAILQIGTVAFEAKSGGRINTQPDKTFCHYVKVDSLFGSVDNSTLAWWLSQPNAKEMGTELKQAPDLETVLSLFYSWPQTAFGLSGWDGIRGVWAKGADMDLAILRNAFGLFGLEQPWHYQASRCCRTLFDLIGGVPQIDWSWARDHHALDDAIGQAQQVQKTLGVLGIEL